MIGMMSEPSEHDRRREDRRSPAGDFLLAELARRGGEPLAYAELLRVAGEHGLSISIVLAWAGLAEEAGLLEQLAVPERALRLTDAGIEVARRNRRRFERRRDWAPPPDEFA